MPSMPTRVPCDECLRILRALRSAWQADSEVLHAKAHAVARSTGRGVRQFSIAWVFSVATMPDGEMRALLDAHYPRVAEASRLREQHEAASGHSLKGWWILSQYGRDR